MLIQIIVAFSYAALVTWVFMTAWFFIALLLKRNDVADVAWGFGFIVLALSLFIRNGNSNAKSYIAITMVIVWGIRLATHIAARHRNKPEDGRYQQMRDSWRFKKLQSYTNVFMTQGFFLLLVSVPIILFFSNEYRTIHWYNLIGLLIWIIGFLFEAISDLQLTRFINNPANKGKVMRYGLWSLSRHPNYFGEISLWWGFYIFTLFTPFWVIGLLGPITITFLIIGVSGIPMLEKRYIGYKEYDEYKKNTSAFFPSLPKKS